MSDDALRRKIRDVLKEGYFEDESDAVYVLDGDWPGNFHVVIISPKFDGRRMKEKHDLIWDEIFSTLTAEEWGKVSLTVGHSPRELTAII